MENKIQESATNKLHALIVSWRREFVDKIEHEKREIKNRRQHESWPSEFMKLRVPKVGDVSILENLILEGANLDVIEQRGILCLLYSFWNEDVIRFFLGHDRDINSRDGGGNTPLIWAARYSLYSVIQFLLANGADPNISNLMGETALFVLVKRNTEVPLPGVPGEDDFSEQTKTVEILVNFGANIESMNTKGLTLLHSNQLFRFVLFDEIKRKLETDRLVNLKSSKLSYERTPLITAAVEGDLARIDDLITVNAEVNAEDMLGFRAIHYAAMAHDPRCYSSLISAGADTKLLTASGRNVTELFCLSGNGNLKWINTTCEDDPLTQIKMYELAGAIAILDKRDSHRAIGLWDKAANLRDSLKIGLGLPKLELTERQKSVYKITKEYETKQDLIQKDKFELISTALLTLERSSPDGSGFWNLLFGMCKVFNWKKQRFNRDYPVILERINEILSYASETMKISEDDKGLLDCPNTDTISNLIAYIYRCYDTNPADQTRSFIRKWRPRVHFIAKLCCAYIKAWKKQVRSNVTPCFEMLFQACQLLAFFNFGVKDQIDVILTGDIVDEDPRDYNGNSILHIACYLWQWEIIKAILDRNVDVRRGLASVTNVYGEIPSDALCPDPKVVKTCCLIHVLERMAGSGEDFALNNYHLLAVCFICDKHKVFPFTSLQCLCARALTKSEVVYKDQVPKRILDFINSHAFPRLPNEALHWQYTCNIFLY